ncbi:acetate--CoA ligase [Paraliomyxa miuraensis]|uniref:acetate--CoA ligase n=1 Tax=Paraliomyxa miuraensis TaxID=376150 RepID=UPI00224D2960|nr:acetate--CoA ligase [Paraliomyxa miuraensis]MCX4241265.1 acetate--CoA ligase [Paraliomyxa miuraensis]
MSTIKSVSKESRIFEPPAAFAQQARVSTREQYDALYRRSIDDPEGFWGDLASELHWFSKPTKIRQWDPPFAKWFEDGTTNLAYNCLDRHVAEGRGDRVALVWEGEPGETLTFTYAELSRQVQRFANGLLRAGVVEGDRVVIYMGMVPEAAIAMLACARIGAVHSVIFGGFAADAVRDRVLDAGATTILTQDGAWRRGKVVALKAQVDKALEQCPDVARTIVLRRTGNEITMKEGRDHEWTAVLEGVSDEHQAPALPAEHPLFILYTSGTTGKPKGVLHTTGGYMVGTYVTTKYVFDLRDDDVYWCTADVGWITGHSYIAYGPLTNGATVLMYEGAPNHPGLDRFWEIIAKHQVTIFYTAPTAIRAFIKWGDEHPSKHDLSSLRLLGTVGEPINPEAWMWYRRVIGGDRCPIIDTWWQTETGAIMMTPLPGAIPAKPGSCTLPFFGVSPKILREDGSEAETNEGGYLVIDQPWPSMLRTVWGNDERFRQGYFSRFPGKYFTGDGARRDEHGYFWVMGRVDDVVNVSGHRLGTAELESALVAHPTVAEAAVVARPDELTGQALVAFVTLKGGVTPSGELKKELADHVGNEIGKFARPASVRFADAVPKTRSGKIMRRLLAELAAGKEPAGDVTTLEDISVLAALRGDDE